MYNQRHTNANLIYPNANLSSKMYHVKMYIGVRWLTILAFLSINVLSAPQSDLINSLPRQPAVTFKQYAGYVTVDEQRGRVLFYYFVEAETDPDLKPLVLWLNGGPGCSSLGYGALSENGPFRPNGSQLIRNNYSWNKEANILYLESPAGVGFSYSNDSSDYIGTNDTKTAKDNLIFLHGWYKIFPEYKTRELYLTGESYAGHYIPQLAELIVHANRRGEIFNLKGIAIGNPLLDFFTDFNAKAEFIWSHGLISDSSYSLMKTVCNYSRYADEYYRGNISNSCIAVYITVGNEISQYIDRYDVTLDICRSAVGTQNPKTPKMMGIRLTGPPDVCIKNEVTAYLNMVDVQKAFHARLVGSVQNWSTCSSVLKYDNLNWEIPIIPLLGKLVTAGMRVLIYSGDQDSVIPLTGTRTLVSNLATSLQLNTTVPYSVWFQGKQVAGWVQVYENLTFATVRGAAHEVPYSQPERSLVLFKAFLQGQPPPAS